MVTSSNEGLATHGVEATSVSSAVAVGIQNVINLYSNSGNMRQEIHSDCNIESASGRGRGRVLSRVYSREFENETLS